MSLISASSTSVAHQEPGSVHWGSVLRLPYTAQVLGGALSARMPCGMMPVALLLAARADGHGYAAGALLASVYGLAVAVGQPLLGRMVDRSGQTLTLVVSAIMSTFALVVLAVAGTSDLRVTVPAVVTAGVAAPPVEGALRALWPILTPTPQHLNAASALDSGSQELVYVAGPLVVGASASTPGLAFSAAAVLGLGGAVAVAASAPSRRWRPVPIRRRTVGALGSGGMRWLLLALTAIGASLGSLPVAALAVSERYHAGWVASVVPAAMSVGALLGAAAWTALPLPIPPGRQLLVSAAAFAASWVPLCLDPPPYAALGLVLVPGITFGALLTCAYQAVATVAPHGTLVEAYGWLITAFSLGQALGAAAAGPLMGSWLVPAAAALLAVPVCQHLTLRASAARSSRPIPEGSS